VGTRHVREESSAMTEATDAENGVFETVATIDNG
jgi:hypothetical protein